MIGFVPRSPLFVVIVDRGIRAVLFADKWNPSDFAPRLNVAVPFHAALSGTRSTFAADDHPRNALKIENTKVFKQWLQGQETDRSRRFFQKVNPSLASLI